MTAGVWSRSRRATSGRDEGAEGRAPVGDRGPGLQRERHGGRYDIVFQVEKLRENQWWILPRALLTLQLYVIGMLEGAYMCFSRWSSGFVSVVLQCSGLLPSSR